MKVEIWSDYVCPFCYIGKRNLELALKQSGKDKDVDIIFRSFELDPNSQTHYDKNINKLMADKYGISLEKATATNERIIQSAKQVGLDYNFDDLKPTNTFDAHRLSHYAKAEDKLNDFTEVLMRSYFTDSLNISDSDVLALVAVEIGLDKEKALAILESSDFSEEVRKEESEGYNRGVNGVPYFLFDGKDAVSGAQPVETLVKVINGLNKQEN